MTPAPDEPFPESAGSDGQPGAARAVPVWRVGAEGVRYDTDELVVEEPLEVRVGERSLLVTMRTPGHDDELAVGFLFSEGIVRAPNDVVSVAHCGPPVAGKGLRNVIRVELGDDAEVDLKRLERHFYTTYLIFVVFPRYFQFSLSNP